MYAILNIIIIQGRLTADPELRYTQNQTAVASFTVAVERDYSQNGEKETDFVSCVAWRQGAEFVSRYFRKGNLIVVDGRLQSRKWEDRDGNKRTSWEVIADHTYFGSAKSDESRSESSYQAPPSRDPAYPTAYSGMHDLGPGTGSGNPFTQSRQLSISDMPDDDGELPF